MASSPRQPLNRREVRRIPGSNSPHTNEQLVKIGTANVGTLVGRSREVVEMLERRRLDVCCIQEVRYRGVGTMSIGQDTHKYKLWWSGSKDRQNGVGILVKDEIAEDVIEVIRISGRIMNIRMILGKGIVNIFSVYAPQSGRSEEEKQEFWEKISNAVSGVPLTEGLIIGGDLNGHIGTDRTGFEDIRGIYGIGERNQEGEAVLEFCQSHSLTILNTMYKKTREKLITYKSGNAETQIDFLLMRKMENIKDKDCAVIPGEACLPQHRLLRGEFIVRNRKKKKKQLVEKIKIWKLKDEDVKKEYQEKVQEKFEARSGMTPRIEDDIHAAAKEVCGVTNGNRQAERETWWWNAEVQTAIQEKKRAFKHWQQTRSEVDREIYRQKRREAKRQVAIAKKRCWEEWAENLNTVEGRNRIFRYAKWMRKDRKDVIGAKYVKNRNGAIMFEEREILECWRQYFENLLNEENPYELENVEIIEGPVEMPSELEIKRALKKMKNGKAPGPSGVTSDMIKLAGDPAVKELLRLCEFMMREESIPEIWEESHTTTVFKGKGDAMECGSYRGIRLLEHCMKIWEKVLEERLRTLVKIDKCQFGFMAGRSTTDAIFVMRQLQEKYGAKRKQLFHIFVDLEKAFDRVPREAIRWALRRQLVPEKLINQVMLLYQNTRTRVKTSVGTSESFEIKVGVHQGSALSPLLFIIIMEEATKECRKGTPWELLYADDLVLTAESEEEVKEMFNRWKVGMERRGLKINLGKTKFMKTGKEAKEKVQSGRWPCGCCGRGVGVNSILCIDCNKWCHKRCSRLRNLNGVENFRCPSCLGREERMVEEEDGIRVHEYVLEQVDHFCYLGDTLDCEGGVERAVRTRIASAWGKWREIAGLLLNKSIPLQNRAKVYDACIRPVILYSAETWPLTQKLEEVLKRCDYRMLRFMAGVKWEDGLSNDEVAMRCGLQKLDQKLVTQRLRWFGHVTRREEENPTKEILNIEVEGRRPVGRPRKTWRRCVDEDMARLGVGEESALDRVEWRRLISSNPARENMT